MIYKELALLEGTMVTINRHIDIPGVMGKFCASIAPLSPLPPAKPGNAHIDITSHHAPLPEDNRAMRETDNTETPPGGETLGNENSDQGDQQGGW